jgi:hypothetical protein
VSHKVPPKGSAVFAPSHDKRTEFLIPVGGVLLRAKMPAPTRKGEAKPIVPEVIRMEDKVLSKRPLMEDPYHLDGV